MEKNKIRRWGVFLVLMRSVLVGLFLSGCQREGGVSNEDLLTMRSSLSEISLETSLVTSLSWRAHTPKNLSIDGEKRSLTLELAGEIREDEEAHLARQLAKLVLLTEGLDVAYGKADGSTMLWVTEDVLKVLPSRQGKGEPKTSEEWLECLQDVDRLQVHLEEGGGEVIDSTPLKVTPIRESHR